MTESFFVSSPLPSTFTSARVFLIEPLRDQRLGVDRVAVLEDALEVADVDRLRRGAERPDRHRVLRRRAALLADAHVERHLPALEAGAHLVRAERDFWPLIPRPE